MGDGILVLIYIEIIIFLLGLLFEHPFAIIFGLALGEAFIIALTINWIMKSGEEK